MSPFRRALPGPFTTSAVGTTYNLDTSGVAGFFGGHVAVESLKTLYIYSGRRWLGWYNMPGSLDVAQFYGRLARAPFWDAIFPGPDSNPAAVFDMDSNQGPTFKAVHLGRIKLTTGHVAQLLFDRCKRDDIESVAVHHEDDEHPAFPVYVVHLDDAKKPQSGQPVHALHSSNLPALIPIVATSAAAVACVAVDPANQDWYSFSLIVFGMLASGISRIVMGSGNLIFKIAHAPPSSRDEPLRSDGILESPRHSQIVVLLGTEDKVSAITRGRFELEFQPMKRVLGERYHVFGICSLLLTAQFLVQLFLIPLGTLFGQIMFLFSLAVSWGYNAYLCSDNQRDAQQDILMQEILDLKPQAIKKYELSSRVEMVAFVLMVLAMEERSREDLEIFLEQIFPSQAAWWRWRKKMMLKLALTRASDLQNPLPHPRGNTPKHRAAVIAEMIGEVVEDTTIKGTAEERLIVPMNLEAGEFTGAIKWAGWDSWEPAKA